MPEEPFGGDLGILAGFFYCPVQKVREIQSPRAVTLGILLHQRLNNVKPGVKLPDRAHNRSPAEQVQGPEHGRQDVPRLHQHPGQPVPLNQHPLHCYQPDLGLAAEGAQRGLLVEVALFQHQCFLRGVPFWDHQEKQIGAFSVRACLSRGLHRQQRPTCLRFVPREADVAVRLLLEHSQPTAPQNQEGERAVLEIRAEEDDHERDLQGGRARKGREKGR